MVCIEGIDLLCDKCIVIGLIYIYGIGNIFVQKIFVEVGVLEDVCVCDLIFDQEDKICVVVDGYKIEGDLCCEVSLNIKLL